MMSSPLMFRLGLTVAHALWELAALGLLAWIGLALLRRQSPQARYAWACAGLFAMVLAPAATFLLIAPSAGTAPFLGELVVGTADEGVARAATIATLIHAALPWLAWGWLAGTALMTARFGAGVAWLHHTYGRSCREATADLEARFQHLRERFGLPSRLQLRLSPGADTPMVLGWWRPVVLLPVSALLHLSPASLEAVLAHELAHLRRRDPLVNLLQSLAEALLFFHPLAWWLSREIRSLREQCCDDEAVALTRDPLPLAEGLAALARLGHPSSTLPEPALAAAKGPLMSRISRLFRPQDASLPSFPALAWSFAALLACGALAHAQEKKAQAKPKPKPKPAVAAAAEGDKTVHDFDFSQIKVLSRPKGMDYPAEARMKKIQGTVSVEMLIDTEGAVKRATAVSGPDELRIAAERFAEEWRFAPAKKDGKAVPARFKLTVNFKLQ